MCAINGKDEGEPRGAFLRHLVDRGLKGVRLIISDACRGLMKSAEEYLPEARWQRCMVHFYQNVFCHVPATKIREVSHMLKLSMPRRAGKRPIRRRERSSTTCAPLG
jgi:transposase-like protein